MNNNKCSINKVKGSAKKHNEITPKALYHETIYP